jgi:hypothetical protein
MYTVSAAGSERGSRSSRITEKASVVRTGTGNGASRRQAITGQMMRKRNIPLKAGLWLQPLFFIALAFAPNLSAQQRGLVFMERPKLAIELSYEFEEEDRESPFGDTESSSHDFRESLTVGTEGWVYHPNLMTYRLFLEPEWRQEDFDGSAGGIGDTASPDRDTTLLGYDVGATFLGQKPLSLDLFASRQSRQLDLTGIEDSDLDSETVGARLHFNDATFPATIGFTNRKYERTGYYESQEERNEFRADIRHNIAKSFTELSLLHDETDRTNRAVPMDVQIDSETTNAELRNTYFFSNDERIRLDSLAYALRSEFDGTELDTWRLSENLFWTHSKELLTQYRYNFTRREFDSFDSTENALRGGLTHRLANRLTTNIGAEAAFNDFGDGSEDRYQGDLDLLYHQPIPWGSLEFGSGWRYGETERSGDPTIAPFLEHPVLETGEDTFLDKENVLLDSIVVTNVGGTIVYTKNVDYRVEVIGPDVRIERTLFGDIEDGQQVTVGYNYRIDTGFDDATFGQDYRFSLELFRLLYFTYTHGRLDQNVLSGEPLTEPLDDTFNLARLRLDAGWSETQLLYHEQDRESRTSTVTRSIRQFFRFHPFRDFHVTVNGDLGQREFTDINEDETFYTVGANVGWVPRWWCDVSLIGLRNSISGDRLDMTFTEIAPRVRLRYGVWTGTISYWLKYQEDEENDNSLWQQRVYVAINRSLW